MMKVSTLTDLLRHIKYDILDEMFNDLTFCLYDDGIAFELYDAREIAVVYEGDPDNVIVTGLESAEGPEVEFGVIKDVYGIMKAIKDNHEVLDELFKKGE